MCISIEIPHVPHVHDMREIAERVLFAETLDEKLRLGPLTVSDSQRGRPIALPDGPGRPKELRVRRDGVRVDFPGVNRLDDARERGCFRDRAARPKAGRRPPLIWTSAIIASGSSGLWFHCILE